MVGVVLPLLVTTNSERDVMVSDPHEYIALSVDICIEQRS